MRAATVEMTVSSAKVIDIKVLKRDALRAPPSVCFLNNILCFCSVNPTW